MPRACVAGMLSELEHKTGWSLAEGGRAGKVTTASSGVPDLRVAKRGADREIAYVLAVARDHLIAVPTRPRRADVLAAAGPGASVLS